MDRDRQEPRVPEYGHRNRKLEWRTEWFHLGRSRNDEVLGATLERALREKRALIEKQRDRTDHMAAYGPAGAGTPWYSIGPRNINGRVKSIAVHPTDPDIVYAAAASGGVWKTTDAGQSWRPLWDTQESLTFGSIAIAPSEPDTIYAGTGEWTPNWGPSYPGSGMYVSNDAGASWVRHTSLVTRRVSKVAVSPVDASTVLAAGNSGLERSTDGGVGWDTVLAGLIADVVFDPNDGNICYASRDDDGIYRSTDAGVSWDLLPAGPTGAAANWAKLAIGTAGAHGSEFLAVKSVGTVHLSTDAGLTWSTVAGSHGVGWTGWCDMIAVAPDDEDVIVVGGKASSVELTTDGGVMWSAIGGLHADHHVAVFAPSNPDIVYECNDGGVYRSSDKCASFKKVSDGLVVTQFYDVNAWDPLSNVIGGGTQDNGTNMTTGGLTWRPIKGNDGGYFMVHHTDPRTMYAEHQNTQIFKSTDGGNSWVSKVGGLSDGTPWTGVMEMDPVDPDKVYCGTTRVFRNTDGLVTDWVSSSQILAGTVSSISVARSDTDRVYAAGGTHVYRSDDAGVTNPWADKTAAPLPARVIKDLAVDRTDADRLVLCCGGTGTGHVFLSLDGGDSWSDISGNLPDVPCNAVALDPNDDNTAYVGTDVGVYRTQDGGTTWEAFDNGLPNVIIADLHVDAEDNALYAATFGRGMYKVGIAPGASEPPVDLYLRDSLLDTGERFPSPTGIPNPNDTADTVRYWESPDIKVDVTPFFNQDALFDGVEFDLQLPHQDPIRTEVNRIHLQVHNRGWTTASDVRVRAFFASAASGLPSLPNPLTPPDFDLSSTVDWQPIGPAKTIAVLEPNRPVIVSWDWQIPAGATTHSCLLAVVSNPDDPITTAETNADALVRNEKRVCLKNLHVISAAGPRPDQYLLPIQFHNALRDHTTLDIVIDPDDFVEGTIGLLLEPVVLDERALKDVTIYRARPGEYLGEWYQRPGDDPWPGRDDYLHQLDQERIFEFSSTKRAEIRRVPVSPGRSIRGLLTVRGTHKTPYGSPQRFSVSQRQGDRIVGGSTYELRLRRARGLAAVSHIRVTLDRLSLETHLPAQEPMWARVVFDNSRTHWTHMPAQGRVDVHLFDGYVAEADNMTVSLHPAGEDGLPRETETLYSGQFNHPPETWVGEHTDPHLALMLRVESLPL
ncbi:WD40/YVTN/BNR-like repeat-containing protein [Saccharothrix luteola]|uniref:WD40/YVTN/BNR-like repeat-containing protein n=1 Tax=Saccharothrix luteola TaxID=2893018 RepID=UPI001E3370A1|nr:hypothetical protein [Saccharothrix luteola]MCC8251211.1 hypothetical protein [Saccharothrix luteola]